MLGLMMLIVAIGVTAGTAAQASQKGGLYILYIGKMKDISSTARIVPNENHIFLRNPNTNVFHISGLFIITIVLLLRGTYYLTMKASHVDGPV